MLLFHHLAACCCLPGPHSQEPHVVVALLFIEDCAGAVGIAGWAIGAGAGAGLDCTGLPGAHSAAQEKDLGDIWSCVHEKAPQRKRSEHRARLHRVHSKYRARVQGCGHALYLTAIQSPTSLAVPAR